MYDILMYQCFHFFETYCFNTSMKGLFRILFP